ncbi:M28 family peptidase [Aquirufa sp.]|jgi:Zn-dependent M28 family amino/carboxypeptidase|uniref:M28 family peptidase n=1 Tax=Aquirufa sp. TaxID=2676249 RepID=UPI0037842067
MNRSRIALFLLLVFALTGAYFVWKPAAEVPAAEVNLVETPDFKADSAYAFIEKQVQFGPRIPGSVASQNTLQFLVAKLKSYGWTVTEQPFTAFRYDGKKLQGTNIIAQFQPSVAKRILLAAHWDARSIADKDSVRKDEPIDAANDGASGVGVLLEIARNLHEAKNKPAVGVDIVLFDLEDHGEPEDYAGEHKPNSWALGSQHWAANLVPANYKAYYGILLDMVGGKGAMFPHEGSSMQYAPGIVRSVWSTATDLGYSNLFVDQDAFGISDDHTAVNEIAKIQMIDIIDLRAANGGFEFGSFHHTHADNLANIDKTTLKAVGQTLLQVLYRE